MATINFTFDTKSKEMALTIDGKAIDNVAGVNIYSNSYSDKDEYRCSIMQTWEDEDTDIQYMSQMCASDSAEAKPAIAANATHPTGSDEFVYIEAETVAAASPIDDDDEDDTELECDIEKFFVKE